MSERKKIDQISVATENAIKRKGAVSLPDRPSDENMTAEDIKKALFSPVLDVTNSAISEIKRVITESNECFENVFKTMPKFELDGSTLNITTDTEE